MNKYVYFILTTLLVAAIHFLVGYVLDTSIWPSERMTLALEIGYSIFFSTILVGLFTVLDWYKLRKNKKG